MRPPDAPPPHHKGGADDRTHGSEGQGSQYPDCPHCAVIYLRPNRRERRRREKAGVPVPEWMALHADQCPLTGENYKPGYLVVGRARSAVR